MAKKGHIAWNKGKSMKNYPNSGFQIGHKDLVSKKGRKSQSELTKGINNYKWKGSDAGIIAIHLWISRWKGKPKICEVCGTIKAKKYEWANIDHKYRRVLEDYIRMCSSCHRKYDIKNNNYQIGFIKNKN